MVIEKCLRRPSTVVAILIDTLAHGVSSRRSLRSDNRDRRGRFNVFDEQTFRFTRENDPRVHLPNGVFEKRANRLRPFRLGELLARNGEIGPRDETRRRESNGRALLLLLLSSSDFRALIPLGASGGGGGISRTDCATQHSRGGFRGERARAPWATRNGGGAKIPRNHPLQLTVNGILINSGGGNARRRAIYYAREREETRGHRYARARAPLVFVCVRGSSKRF